jgi:hypothetical protein
MNYRNIKTKVRFFVLQAILGLALFPTSVVRAIDNPNGPVLRAQCGSLQIEEGNKLAFHVYAHVVFRSIDGMVRHGILSHRMLSSSPKLETIMLGQRGKVRVEVRS